VTRELRATSGPPTFVSSDLNWSIGPALSPSSASTSSSESFSGTFTIVPSTNRPTKFPSTMMYFTSGMSATSAFCSSSSDQLSKSNSSAGAVVLLVAMMALLIGVLGFGCDSGRGDPIAPRPLACYSSSAPGTPVHCQNGAPLKRSSSCQVNVTAWPSTSPRVDWSGSTDVTAATPSWRFSVPFRYFVMT
jgi:hypothetical protein